MPISDKLYFANCFKIFAKMPIFVALKKLRMKLLKGTKLYSIFTSKCPVCHKGDMYVENNPYKVTKLMKMHEFCSHCGKKFKIEPSFFFGAMYVSYAVGVAIAVAAFIISFFFLDLGRNYSFLAIIITLAVLFPIIVRVSRNIWINFFVDYDREKAEK
tara:strand:- start:35958 stop:36431 length:474 start_codon:yes stop_codon:yes gene_type:complete